MRAVHVIALAVGVVPVRLLAQTDFFNTDAGRPIQIEDAYAIEYRGFEIQAAPLRLERSRGAVRNLGVEPELTVGILPRTQLSVGAPIAYLDAGTGRRVSGLAGIDASVLYNLNAETTIPALAIVGDVLVPAGGLSPDRAYPSLKGIVTRSSRWARVHVNGQYTLGRALPDEAPESGRGPTAVGPQTLELSRWLAGVAVDRTFPLRALLVTGEAYARRPLHGGAAVEYDAGAGLRAQLTPRTALDLGGGRRLTGPDRGGYVTAGAAYTFGLPWSGR